MAHLCSLQLAGLREPSLHWTLSFAQARTCHTRSLCSHDGTRPSPLGWQHGAFNGKSLGFLPGLIPPKKAALRVSCSGNPVVTFLSPDWTKQVASLLLKAASTVTSRAHQVLQANPLVSQVAPALAIVVFSIWVLGPLLRAVRHIVFKKDDRRWKDSQTRYILSSYLRPVFLWVGVILLCRAFDPVVLSTEASQAIKERFLNFVRSLSTVVAFAYCTASLTQHLQKLTMEHQSLENSRNVGVQFIGNTVYSAVWVAAVCLFMELLGFSTQKWLTAGGLGTVLITLAGREIFTNFLSGVMIHATRPFVENEWIQAKIEGYEVSGTVEQVGWWSPTIIRGEDREAVHIPNHKFTVSVVRNLSQKTHWRIKTHLCISHLDVNKIPNIVADMRKVLAKHPQVEQKRLHRRVFLENVDTENQALMILVSCFVKTSHFEEYLRVKEVILLDLLKVISHHRARLSTPIRSMQRISDDSEPRHSPFRDVGSRPTDNTRERPLLLVEASTVVDRKEETKRTPHEADVASRPKEGPTIESQLQQAEVGSKHHPPLEGLDSMGLNSKDITLLGAAFEKPPAIIPETLVESPGESSNAHKVPQVGVTEHSEISIVKSESLSTERSITSPAEKGFQESTKPEEPLQEKPSKGHGFPMPKLDGDSHGSVARPQLEDNLVLGVALDGPKRTLPLNNDTVIATERELVTSSRNGNGATGMKENSERSSPKPSPSLDSREKER